MKPRNRLDVLRKISAMLSLFILTSNNSVKADSIYSKITQSYQEWGEPIHGDYIESIYYGMPTSIIQYLKDIQILLHQNL